MMTSSTHSFAYSYRLVKKCFVKICETSECHSFLIFQPIFIRFSLLCLKNFTLSSEIKLNLLWSSSLTYMIMYKKIFTEGAEKYARDHPGGGGGGVSLPCRKGVFFSHTASPTLSFFKEECVFIRHRTLGLPHNKLLETLIQNVILGYLSQHYNN